MTDEQVPKNLLHATIALRDTLLLLLKTYLFWSLVLVFAPLTATTPHCQLSFNRCILRLTQVQIANGCGEGSVFEEFVDEVNVVWGQ